MAIAMRRWLSAIVSVVCLAAAATTHAQTDGQIVGVVRDVTKKVLPGVTVEASSPALPEKTRSITTDANGQYRINNLPGGTYTVTFRLVGFASERREGVVVTNGFTTPVN